MRRRVRLPVIAGIVLPAGAAGVYDLRPAKAEFCEAMLTALAGVHLPALPGGQPPSPRPRCAPTAGMSA